MPRHFAIVPAAGSGSRFGAERPKQYLELLGRPLIFHTLAALVACPHIERVWVVLAPDDPWWPKFDWHELGAKLETVRCGGETRAESVRNGLQAAAMVAAEDDWVLVHDAARPCLSAEMLAQLFDDLADELEPLLDAPTKLPIAVFQSVLLLSWMRTKNMRAHFLDLFGGYLSKVA